MPARVLRPMLCLLPWNPQNSTGAASRRPGRSLSGSHEPCWMSQVRPTLRIPFPILFQIPCPITFQIPFPVVFQIPCPITFQIPSHIHFPTQLLWLYLLGSALHTRGIRILFLEGGGSLWGGRGAGKGVWVFVFVLLQYDAAGLRPPHHLHACLCQLPSCRRHGSGYVKPPRPRY